MFVSSLLANIYLIFPSLILSTLALHINHRSTLCIPFQSTFSSSSVASSGSAPFIALSPDSSYRVGSNGLELILQKPDGKIITKDGANSQVAEGATINSTFTLLYGRVTFSVSSPTIPGVVTAAILIADQGDEIDVELLGGDPSHWQTNVFVPTSSDKEPLWGVFSSVEDVKTPIRELHDYSIDWSPERVVWAVDGKSVRTLYPEQTRKNKVLHYPTHPARIQLGIWDASSPVGTAAWAKGPIDWKSAPEKMIAIVKKVVVDCPED